MNKIKFAEYGRVYLSIDIKPQNEITMFPVRFKVDTGADATAISKLDLIFFGYDMAWIRR